MVEVSPLEKHWILCYNNRINMKGVGMKQSKNLIQSVFPLRGGGTSKPYVERVLTYQLLVKPYADLISHLSVKSVHLLLPKY